MNNAEIQQIRSMSFRKAQSKFRIGYPVWKRVKSGESEVYRIHRGGRRDFKVHTERVARVVESVKLEPHVNTVERAKKLGLRTETVQGILKGEKLTRLNARLQRAGFVVESVQPLQAARLRRIVASSPGRLLHADHKIFGLLRREDGSPPIKISGCIIIDSFTSFAQVYLDRTQSGESVVEAIKKFREAAPFPISKAIILSDNSQAFFSEVYLKFCAEQLLLPRTIRISHPWSNGKVEALNKTLKYQCFPVVCATRGLTDAQIQGLVDAWMKYYNEQRVHTGHMNRGLPPTALYNYYVALEGSPIDKLVQLGVIKADEVPYLRVMGFTKNESKQAMHSYLIHPEFLKGLPPAFVIDKAKSPDFIPKENSALEGVPAMREFRPAK